MSEVLGHDVSSFVTDAHEYTNKGSVLLEERHAHESSHPQYSICTTAAFMCSEKKTSTTRSESLHLVFS